MGDVCICRLSGQGQGHKSKKSSCSVNLHSSIASSLFVKSSSSSSCLRSQRGPLRHEEWLISITSRVCCRCRYEPERSICCVVDQDGASSPDQAGDQVTGRRGHGEPGGLGPPHSVWQYGQRLRRDCEMQFVYSYKTICRTDYRVLDRTTVGA